MDKSKAKKRIKDLAKTNPKIDGVGNLFVDLGFEFLAGGKETEIKKAKNTLGEIDLIFKDTLNKNIFIIEVTKQRDDRTLKIEHFFSFWRRGNNLGVISRRYSLPITYAVHYLYFDLSPKHDRPPCVDGIIQNKKNHYLNNYDLRYFCDAFDKVGKWAVNDLLSFLDIKPKTRTNAIINATQFFLGSVRAYSYVESVNNLLQYCYVFRRKKDDSGYQRMIRRERIDRIAKRIQNNTLFAFPNSILVSCPDVNRICDNPEEISDCPAEVEIKIPNYFCACRIIDGQHRLLGFSKLDETLQEQHFIPVVVLENIEQQDEIKTFIDINSGQKKIDRDHIMVLEADFPWEVDKNPKEFYEKKAVVIAKKLNRTDPLKERIFIPEALAKKKGKIALNTFVMAILNNKFIGPKKCLFQRDYNDNKTPYDKIKEIFILAKKHIPKHCRDADSFFMTNQGVRVLFRVIQIFTRNNINETITVSLEDFLKDLGKVLTNTVIEILKDFYGEGGATRATEEVFKVLKAKYKTKYKGLTTSLMRIKIP